MSQLFLPGPAPKWPTFTGWALTFVAMLAVSAGCGGGGSPGGGGGGGDSIVTRSQVAVLPSDSIGTVTGNSVTVSGDAPGIEAGSVIVSAKGDGVMRKVLAVQRGRGDTVFTTEDAGLPDVFEKATFSFSPDLPPSSFDKMTPLLEGVSFDSQKSRENIEIIKLKLADVKLLSGGQIPLKLTGSVNLKLGVDFMGEIDLMGVKSVRFVPMISASLDAKLSHSGYGDTIRIDRAEEIKFAHLDGAPITFFVGALPPIPLVMVPSIDLSFMMGGSIRLDNGVRFSASTSLSAGLVYARSTGWTQTLGVINKSIKTEFNPLKSATFEAYANLLRVKLSFKLMGMAGPYLTLDAPSLTLSAQSQSEPAGINVVASADLVGGAGFEAKIPGTGWGISCDFPNAFATNIDQYHSFVPLSGGTNVVIR